jgi:hypothetical protein
MRYDWSVKTRTTIYLYLAIRQMLREGDEDRVSARLRTICQRLGRVIDAAMPEFSRAEWCALFDGNSRIGITDWPGLWENLTEDAQALSEKWDVDVPSLVARLQGLTVPELVTLCEIIDKFWADCPDLDLETAFSKLGVRVVEESNRLEH